MKIAAFCTLARLSPLKYIVTAKPVLKAPKMNKKIQEVRSNDKFTKRIEGNRMISVTV